MALAEPDATWICGITVGIVTVFLDRSFPPSVEPVTTPLQHPAAAEAAPLGTGSPSPLRAVRGAASRWLGGRATKAKEVALLARLRRGLAWVEERRASLPLLIIAVPVLFNALTLLPEITIPVANVNDDAF